MKLPNGDRAFIDVVKLTDYCLNPDHPKGKHKARVFKSALGWTIESAETLFSLIQSAAVECEAVKGVEDQYGSRYTVDVGISIGDRSYLLRTAWIIRAEEDFPRFTSCYLLKKGATDETKD